MFTLFDVWAHGTFRGLFFNIPNAFAVFVVILKAFSTSKIELKKNCIFVWRRINETFLLVLLFSFAFLYSQLACDTYGKTDTIVMSCKRHGTRFAYKVHLTYFIVKVFWHIFPLKIWTKPVKTVQQLITRDYFLYARVRCDKKIGSVLHKELFWSTRC